MITTEDVERVLQNTAALRRCLYAAGRALNVLDGANIEGKTPDGDVAAIVARSQLRAGFEDLESLMEALEMVNDPTGIEVANHIESSVKSDVMDPSNTSGVGWPD